MYKYHSEHPNVINTNISDIYCFFYVLPNYFLGGLFPDFINNVNMLTYNLKNIKFTVCHVDSSTNILCSLCVCDKWVCEIYIIIFILLIIDKSAKLQGIWMWQGEDIAWRNSQALRKWELGVISLPSSWQYIKPSLPLYPLQVLGLTCDFAISLYSYFYINFVPLIWKAVLAWKLNNIIKLNGHKSPYIFLLLKCSWQVEHLWDILTASQFWQFWIIHGKLCGSWASNSSCKASYLNI